LGRKSYLNREDLKDQIISDVEKYREELCQLSRQIHANPELGFHEFRAMAWLTEVLENQGFSLERGIFGLPTAFRATCGKGQPVVALLAEYDALPDLGHACGHNLIAAAAVGAGLASKTVIESLGGRVIVIGTPAEELYGGKITMAHKGAFNDLDSAMMMHPGTQNRAVTSALACQGLSIQFFGQASHAAGSPEKGINALEAMILSYNSINSLRQHIESTARIHGIITDGGQAANIIPAHTAASFLVRADSEAYLSALKQKVVDCFKGAAVATGARLEYRWDELSYAPMLNNLTIGKLFAANMRRLGRYTKMVDPDQSFGSTDFGNVSQLIPGMHASVAIARPGIFTHSPQFAAAAISEKGLQAMLDAAKALAMTVADLVSCPEFLEKAKREFYRSK
jgi:amidohydrolase